MTFPADDEQTIRYSLYNEAVNRGSQNPVHEAAEAWNFIKTGETKKKKKPGATTAAPTSDMFTADPNRAPAPYPVTTPAALPAVADATNAENFYSAPQHPHDEED